MVVPQAVTQLHHTVDITAPSTGAMIAVGTKVISRAMPTGYRMREVALLHATVVVTPAIGPVTTREYG